MTKPTHNPLPIWSIALPIAAWLVYFIGIKGSVPLQLIGGAMLIGSVLSAVHHAARLFWRWRLPCWKWG